MNFSQVNLNKKIILFLEQQLTKAPEIEKKSRQEVIDKLKASKGECVGYSILWAYGKVVSDVKKTDKEADDSKHFQKMLEMIDSINEASNLSAADSEELERFISQLIFYQNTRDFLEEPAELMHNVSSNGALNRGFGYNFNLNLLPHSKLSLKRSVKDLVKKGEIVFLSFPAETSGHIIAVYQSRIDGKIYFYDSNSSQGEITINNIDEVIEEFWKSSDPKNQENPMAGIRVDKVLKDSLRSVQIQGFYSIDHPGEVNFHRSQENQESSCSMLNVQEFCEAFANASLVRLGINDSDIFSFIKRLPVQSVVEILDKNFSKVTNEVKKLLIKSLVKSQDYSQSALIQAVSQNLDLFAGEEKKEVEKYLEDLTANLQHKLYKLMSSANAMKSEIGGFASDPFGASSSLRQDLRSEIPKVMDLMSLDEVLLVLSKVEYSQCAELIDEGILDRIQENKRAYSQESEQAFKTVVTRCIENDGKRRSWDIFKYSNYAEIIVRACADYGADISKEAIEEISSQDARYSSMFHIVSDKAKDKETPSTSISFTTAYGIQAPLKLYGGR